MKDLVNNILCVIMNSKESYGDDWEDEILHYVKKWVKKNNVKDVEYTVSTEEMIDNYGDDKLIKEIAKDKLNFVEDYTALQDKMQEVIGDSCYDGPGWDGNNREDTRWNNDYFFTGSDCTHYVLIKKIA